MLKPILILAYGNPSRGDDALAPLLLEQIETFPAELTENIECLTDFQLQIEHALDLKQRELVLFVDASVANQQAVELTQINAINDNSYTTHAMSPQAVMQVYENIEKTSPPPCFLMSLQGLHFELGEGLSREATQSLNQAIIKIKLLLAKPTLDCWQAQCDCV
ncbi:MAG: hydrogenase maturation protease [Methylococcaceae bacterium]|nr:hydrogenase maturation protease [Methylococcaceae bacterium]